MRRTRGFWRFGLVAGLVPVALLLQGAPADAVTETFSEPGTDSFTVPTGICSVLITAAGAQGGTLAEQAGGVGASVTGRITVAPGLVLGILVAQEGGSGDAGNGGDG